MPTDTPPGWPAPLTVLAAGISLGVTAMAYAGLVDFELHDSTAHLVLDTADAFVALVVAYLIYGRFRRTGSAQDFLLLQGLALLSVAGFGTTAVVWTVGDGRQGALEVWLPLAVRVSGILAITAAALVGPLKIVGAGWRRLSLAPAAAIFAVLGLALASMASRLPVAMDPRLAPGAVADNLTLAHPVLVAGMALAVGCFAVSAVAFSRQALRSHDALLRWLGPAFAVAAVARLNYVLFPSLYSNWLTIGDLLRTAAYLLLLVGAAQEIRQYWSSQASLAVVEDRRRLARELHDGLLQELGLIRAETRAFCAADAARAQRVLGACDRAMDEARQAVEALGHSADERLGFALHRAARQVADRYEVALELDVDDSVDASDDQRHALLRITREAIANAARHGRPQRVSVRLAADGHGRQLVVSDDGSGFDPERAGRERRGFGLISMRERAEGLPGTFDLQSAPGSGTQVTVRW